MTPEERIWNVLTEICSIIQDAEARGYRAAQEQAAEVAEALTRKHGHPIGPEYAQGVNDHGIRCIGAIRAMKPKETGDDT